MRPSTIAVVAFFAVLGCQPQTGSLSEADLAAIRSLPAAFDQVVLDGDWDAFVAMFTENGILMQPNEAVIPISEFRSWFEPMGYSALEHQVEFTDIDGRADLAYASGTYSERFTVAGVEEPIADMGKVLGVLRKQSDGKWLFHIWSSSTDLPATEGEPSDAGEPSS
jgi:uncharacterized protein (TIGR02246 family)